MKEKIIMFVIGLLVGAIITTGVFFVLRQNDSNQARTMGERPENMQMQGGPGDGETPPEKPNGEEPSGEKPNDAPKQKTNDSNSSTSENTTSESNS